MSAPAPEPSPASLEAALALLAQREGEIAALRAAHDGLLHAVSHDLRAPVRHITSFAPLLRESVQALGDSAGEGGAEAAEEARQFLSAMEQASRRLGRMIDALLRIARAARAPLHAEAVDLAALAAEARGGLAAAEPGRAVEWHLPSAPVPVRADVQLMRQLLAELLGNAHKFTQGREHARIALTTEALPGGGLRWHVKDNGAGFDPARAQGLFGVFQRLHREADFEGVGAGLALARTIVQRHGGHISISATTEAPGAGCVVSVDWPA